MDKEAVVNAVLEDSLPEGLKSVDRTMPLLPPEVNYTLRLKLINLFKKFLKKLNKNNILWIFSWRIQMLFFRQD